MFVSPVSDRLSVFPDICCRTNVATESPAAGFHACVDHSSVQVCCQPITAAHFLPHVPGIFDAISKLLSCRFLISFCFSF